MKMWKKIAIIIISLIAIGEGAYLGYLWKSAPLCYVIELERSFRVGPVADFSITPAKVEIVNLWDGRDAIVPVTINNGEGETVFHIGTNPPAKFDEGYTDARGVNECSFEPDTLAVTLASFESRTVNIKVSKLVKGNLTPQEMGISVDQQPSGEAKGIRVVKSNVFEILVR